MTAAKKPHLDYTSIGIIYNPNSTGDAVALADELHQQLDEALPGMPVKLWQTKYAGHGEKLAYKLASETKRALIISVSGDGGYHDVINGAVRAGDEHGTEPICAVRGAGNANDHRRTLKELPLFEAIISKNDLRLDLLRVEIKNKAGKSQVRYAHSYAGLGLTPEVAVELNQHDLTRLKELLLVAKTFKNLEPFTIELTPGIRAQYDNIIFANINQMAKVVSLSPDGAPDDGQFELIATAHASKVKQVAVAAKAAVVGLRPTAKLATFEFGVVRAMPMQLDGEVLQLRRGNRVTVSIAAGKLRTVV
jgi:diacylglycerol kinase (ATP)